MPEQLDLNHWPRRSAFEFFRGFDKPYFNVCTRVDVTALKPALQQCGRGSISLACHYMVMALANAIEPFAYRLQDGKVWLHRPLHLSTTVLLPDESFGFVYLEHAPSYPAFVDAALPVWQAARAGHLGFEPRQDAQALLHCTTLPWLHFSSFSHARQWGREDSVPKFAFGRIDEDSHAGSHVGTARRWMPLSVEVHHALMDGLAVGRFVQGFEAAMKHPLPWLMGAPLRL